MSDSKQKERAGALVRVLDGAMHALGCEHSDHCGDFAMDAAVELLRDCVPIPRADLEALRADAERGRNALWKLMQRAGWPGPVRGWSEFIEFGMATCEGTRWYWTPAAHSFAAEMEKGNVTK